VEPEISVVIVTWNGRQHLQTCLSSVAAQIAVRAETIVVDNGSTDGTAEYVRSQFPWVRLVALGENDVARGEPRGREPRIGKKLEVDSSDRHALNPHCPACCGQDLEVNYDSAKTVL